MKQSIATRCLSIALCLIVLGSVIGCSSQKGWGPIPKGEGEIYKDDDIIGRYFFLGQNTIATLMSHRLKQLEGMNVNLGILVMDLCKSRVEARGIHADKIVPFIGKEWLKDAETGNKAAVLEFHIALLKDKKIRLGFYVGHVPYFPIRKDMPRFIKLEKGELIQVKTDYPDAESFYNGLKAELTPVVDQLLDKALAEIQKAGLTP